MALGATSRKVISEIVSHGLKAALIGIVSAIVITFALSRILSSVVFKVKPTDPTILVTTAILMLVVAFLACYFPARRASKVNPVIALHYE
jgi:putative ABC transport system permease protein